MSPGKKKCQVTRKHYLKMLNKQNLERQLKLLYDANRKFHDTNDSLRKALDQKAISWKLQRFFFFIKTFRIVADF
uniref:Bm2535 n=1 Tax=Brugia malayi TaxID=6279 RepID=A0A5S6PHZ8_BRUMA